MADVYEDDYEPSAIMEFFKWDHLPTEQMRITSEMFEICATFMDRNLQAGPEKSTALRKLLEGKDAAVRQTLLDSRR